MTEGVYLRPNYSAGDYGTATSPLLARIKEAGFHPIAITVMICEETFVFETDKEATEAYKALNTNEGWWYGLDGEYPWKKTLEDYEKEWGKKEVIILDPEKYKIK